MTALFRVALILVAMSLIAGLCNARLIAEPLHALAGPKSAQTPTGPVVDGFALSLAQIPLPHESPKYRWLSLELRNESGETQYVIGYNVLTSINVIATDTRGNNIPSNAHPDLGLDAGPSDSHGVPITPGASFFMRLPIDLMVEFPHKGNYIVRVKTIRVMNVTTGKLINLESNPLTIPIIDSALPHFT